MDSGQSYFVADLTDELKDTGVETSRWTVRERLEDLTKEDRVHRVEHANGNVTYHLSFENVLTPELVEMVEAHATQSNLDFKDALDEVIRAGVDAIEADSKSKPRF